MLSKEEVLIKALKDFIAEKEGISRTWHTYQLTATIKARDKNNTLIADTKLIRLK